jgi:hypothetical protein
MCPEQLPYMRGVNLLEILRSYAEAYVQAGQALNIISALIADYSNNPDADVRSNQGLLDRLRWQAVELSKHCGQLPMTEKAVRSLIRPLNKPDIMKGWTQPIHALQSLIADIQNRMIDELSLAFFFKLSQERKDYFLDPFKDWGDILKKFPDTIGDVEEMNKCFALCRYTAAMYHAMQIAEGGAIELGNYIGVTDHRKGWGPTEKKLRQIIADGHLKLPVNLAGKFEFLEQMNREIDSMVLAWRHKLDHAANHLAIVPNAVFTPDIAEHIMKAIRVFMLRLMEGLP